MKSDIIRSESSLKRYPFIAFVLSFVFTGMGQVYNGELAKGIIFIALRILSLIIIPLFIVTRPANFSALFILIVAGINILIWIIASFDALFSARSKNPYNLKRCNSVLFYFLYGIIFAVLFIFCVIFNFTFFSIEQIGTESMNPYFKAKDYILLNKYPGQLDIADVVSYASGGGHCFGRVMAKYGDVVAKKGDFFINDKALKHGIFSKDETQEMDIANSEELFYEINAGRKYPVLLAQRKNALTLKKILIGDNELFIVLDNRIIDNNYTIIKTSVIIGKVEGIIYTKDVIIPSLKKILSKPFTSAD